MHGIELLVVTQEEDVYIFSVLQLLSPHPVDGAAWQR